MDLHEMIVRYGLLVEKGMDLHDMIVGPGLRWLLIILAVGCLVQAVRVLHWAPFYLLLIVMCSVPFWFM